MKKKHSILLGTLLFLFISIGGFLYYYLTSLPSINPKPGNCKILEQKFCNKVTFLVTGKNNYTIAAYSLPQGATVFVPRDYSALHANPTITTTKGSKTIPSISIISIDQNKSISLISENWSLYYNFKYNNLPKDKNGILNQLGKPGQILDIVSDLYPIIKNSTYNFEVEIDKISSATIHPSNLTVQIENITRKTLQP